MFKEKSNNDLEKNIKNVFELGSDIEKFGGNQKFVLLRNKEEYFIGSLPNISHLEILELMVDKKNDDIEVLGGGMFTFLNNEIIIDDNFRSSKLGPIQIRYSELVEIMQKLLGNKYKVVIGD